MYRYVFLYGVHLVISQIICRMLKAEDTINVNLKVFHILMSELSKRFHRKVAYLQQEPNFVRRKGIV